MSESDIRKKIVTQIKTDVATDLVEKLREKLLEVDKYVKGEAHDSLTYFPEDGIVGSKLDYVHNIEYGRDAGSPLPTTTLVDWVMKKLGITNIEDAQKVAYAVAKKIEADGIPASRFAKIVLAEMSS